MNLIWHWPQVTWAIIVGLGLAITALLNGEKHTVKSNFAFRLVMVAFAAFVLYKGGFWAGVTQ